MASLLLMRGGNNGNDYKACNAQLGSQLPSQITLIVSRIRQAVSWRYPCFVHHKNGKSVA